MSEAHHTFDIRAVDGDGASSTIERNYTVDLTPPDAALTGGPVDGGSGNDSTPTYAGTASDAGGVAAVQVSVDGAALSVAGVACSGCGTPDATWTWTPPGALADGPHSFSFEAVDGAGFNSPALGRTLTIDTVAPNFVTLAGPSLVAQFSEPLSCASVARNDFSATVNGASSKLKSVTCSGALDDGIDIVLSGATLTSG
ncbi:MAG TPA: Ig-like domain-containing protein, partial [Acidimicrobiia bacterium]|nr:Ig-like domain-containing protein [Acidimicrobiia bacterium]